MKLSIKLPLAFAASTLVVVATASFGIYGLNRSLDLYANQVQASNANASAADELLIEFKTQVQEWKNTLLRGKDPKQLEKYWAAFNQIEREMGVKAKKLAASLEAGEARSLVEKFVAAHAAMGQSYQGGFDAFKAAGFDATVGDTAVKGKDREPAELLDKASEKLTQQSVAIAASAAASARKATLVSVVLMLLVSALGIVSGVLFSRRITRPIGQAADVAHAVANGDLSSAITIRGNDEIAALLGALQAMQVNLAAVVNDVRQGSDSVATASAQIAQGNQDLSQRTEEQAGALQQTAASMEQLSSTVKQNADNAMQANQLAQGASSVAMKGGEVVGQVVTTMKGINDSSGRIADIIAVIDGIAFQTNILALNAAVEAARAGEQGRGFAVVASEVRSLAQRSAEAAKEIKSLINASVERVEQGTQLVDQAGTTMAEIVGAIRRVTDIMGEISAASTEQSTGVAQVGEAVGQMDQTTQQNAALVEESAAAAESLKQQAERLVQSVAVFKLGQSGGPRAAVPPVGAATATRAAPAGKRRGPDRATNVARPQFGARPAATAARTEAAPRKSGTDDDWTSF